MNFLLNLFLLCYAIGVFFYPPLYNIGYYGLIVLILIHYKKEKKLQNLFIKFNQNYKLWMILGAIILMAFIGCFYTIAPKNAAFVVFLRRFLTLSTVLIFIPYFIQNENFIKKAIRLFALSGMLYCIIAGFHVPHCLRINPIQSSMLVGYVVVFISCQILLNKKNTYLNVLRLVFFATFLILFNPQKIGIVASIASIASIAKKTSLIFVIFLGLFFVGEYERCALNYRLRNCLQTLVQSHSSTLSDASTNERKSMIKQSLYILKTSPIYGNGTASYVSVIKTRNLELISWKWPLNPSDRWITTVHPHNDFCHWCVQFGYIGGSFFLLLMGYFFIFFLKTMHIPYLNSICGLGTLIFFGVCGMCDMMLGSSIPQSVFILGISILIARTLRTKFASR